MIKLEKLQALPLKSFDGREGGRKIQGEGIRKTRHKERKDTSMEGMGWEGEDGAARDGREASETYDVTMYFFKRNLARDLRFRTRPLKHVSGVCQRKP